MYIFRVADDERVVSVSLVGEAGDDEPEDVLEASAEGDVEADADEGDAGAEPADGSEGGEETEG